MFLGVVVCIEAYRDSQESIGVGPPLARSKCYVTEGMSLAVVHSQRKRLLFVILRFKRVSEEARYNGLSYLNQIDECGIKSYIQGLVLSD